MHPIWGRYCNGLEPHTFNTVFLPLTFVEAQAILYTQRQCLSRNTDRRTTSRNQTEQRDVRTSDTYTSVLTTLEQKIDTICLKNPKLSQGFFVKLNTRSPKDAPIYGFKEQEMKELLKQGYGELRLKHQNQNVNHDLARETETENKEGSEGSECISDGWGDEAETLVYLKTMNKLMKLCHGIDVLEMFKYSYRVHEDLSAGVCLSLTHTHTYTHTHTHTLSLSLFLYIYLYIYIYVSFFGL